MKGKKYVSNHAARAEEDARGQSLPLAPTLFHLFVIVTRTIVLLYCLSADWYAIRRVLAVANKTSNIEKNQIKLSRRDNYYTNFM